MKKNKELIKQIKNLVKSIPNDYTLGNLIRSKIIEHEKSVKK